MPVTRSASKRNARVRIEDPTPPVDSEKKGTTVRGARNRTAKRKLVPHSPEEPPTKRKNARNRAQPKPGSKQREQNQTRSSIRRVKRTGAARGSSNASEGDPQGEPTAPRSVDGVEETGIEPQAVTPGCISARTRSYSEQKRNRKAVQQPGLGICQDNYNGTDKSPDARTMETQVERDGGASVSMDSISLPGLEPQEKSSQEKYTHLVKIIKELQSNFLRAQQNAEKNITAFDNVVQSLKNSLKLEQQRSLLLTEDLTAKKESVKKMREEMQSLYDDIFKLEQSREDDTENGADGRSGGTLSTSRGGAYSEGSADTEKVIQDQKAIIHLYSKLTGIQLHRDAAPIGEGTGALESFACACDPAGSEHHLAFRLILDKEFEEIEYIPEGPSSDTATIFPRLPDYLQENIFFENSQAPKFLARFLESLEALR